MFNVVVRERRDITDSVRGKVFVRVRRDITESVGRNGSVGRDAMLQRVQMGKGRCDVTDRARGN